MNRKLRNFLLGTAAILASSTVAAAPFTVDQLIGTMWAGNDSSIATETDYLQSILDILEPGTDVVYDKRYEEKPFNIQQNIGTTDEWFIDIAPKQPGYFALKFGVGGTGINSDTYFFKNIGELDKLVWSNQQVNYLTGGCSKNNCNIGRLSHYTLFNGGNDDPNEPVPEPATLALLGAGLAGLGWRRRKNG